MNNSKKILRKMTFLFTAFILAIGVFNFWWGEIIQVGRGFGWDGSIYGNLTKHFFFFKYGLDDYLIHRIFPSFIVGSALRLFRVPLYNFTIIKAFELYNLALLLIAIWIFGLISDQLKLSVKGRWLAFLGLFVNFAILKFNFYYPVLTDTTAFTLSMFLLYCYLKNNSVGMLAVLLVSLLTWPILFFSGVFLYIFPKENAPVNQARGRRNIVVGFLVAIAVLSGINYLYFVKGARSVYEVPINNSLVIVSIFITCAYIYLSMKSIVNVEWLYSVRFILQKLRLKRLVLISVIILVMKIATFIFAHGKNEMTMLWYCNQALLRSLTKPFIFGVSHSVYFGPVVLLFLFFWKSFCRVIHSYGLGITLFTMVAVMLSIDSESRHIIHVVPFLIFFLIKAMEEVDWKAKHLIFFGLFSFGYSKAWFQINREPFYGSYFDFPWQNYFMNQGPWISDRMYCIQGAVVLLTAVLFYFFLSSNKMLREKPKKDYRQILVHSLMVVIIMGGFLSSLKYTVRSYWVLKHWQVWDRRSFPGFANQMFRTLENSDTIDVLKRHIKGHATVGFYSNIAYGYEFMMCQVIQSLVAPVILDRDSPGKHQYAIIFIDDQDLIGTPFHDKKIIDYLGYGLYLVSKLAGVPRL